MIKFLSYLSVFLGLVAYIFYTLYTNAKDEIAALETEKNALILNIEEYKKNELEANNTIKNLRKKISDDKEAFDWYNQPIPPAVLNELYKD